MQTFLVLAGLLLPTSGVVVTEALAPHEAPHLEIQKELVQALPGATSSPELAAQLLQASPAEVDFLKAQAEADFRWGSQQLQASLCVTASASLERAASALDRLLNRPDAEQQEERALGRVQLALAVALRCAGGSAAATFGRLNSALQEAVRYLPNRDEQEREVSLYFAGDKTFAMPGQKEFLAQLERARAQLGSQQVELRFVAANANDAPEVMLDGRLLGRSPDVQAVAPGRHRYFLRRAFRSGRFYSFVASPSATPIVIDPTFDEDLRDDGVLAYPSPEMRRLRHVRHGGQLANLVDRAAALLFWVEPGRVHLSLVDRAGRLRAERSFSPESLRLEVAELFAEETRNAAAQAVNLRTPGSGKTPVLIDWGKQPQPIFATAAPAEKAAPRNDEQTCRTPCALFVPPGPLTIQIGQKPAQKEFVVVPDEGLRIYGHRPMSPWLLRAGKTAFGAGLIGIGGMLAWALIEALPQAAIGAVAKSAGSSGDRQYDVSNAWKTAAPYAMGIGSGLVLLGGSILIANSFRPGTATRRLTLREREQAHRMRSQL